MFISKIEKNRIENNIKFLIEEIASLKLKIAKLEGWETVKVKDKPLYKWMKSSGTINVPKGEATVSFPAPKKRGRPAGSKNKVSTKKK